MHSLVELSETFGFVTGMCAVGVRGCSEGPRPPGLPRADRPGCLGGADTLLTMQIPGLSLTVDASGVPWRETSDPGISWFLLASEGAGEGAAAGATVLIRMEPGCGYRPHEHLGLEEVLVLAGGYRDALGEYRAGDWVRYEPGSRHAPVALGQPDEPTGPANPACILYATARGGIRPLEDEERRALG